MVALKEEVFYPESPRSQSFRKPRRATQEAPVRWSGREGTAASSLHSTGRGRNGRSKGSRNATYDWTVGERCWALGSVASCPYLAPGVIRAGE